MAQDLIRYDLLTQDALRGVVRAVLADVAKNGLPGDHHFFIGFSTTAPGVRISNRLRESYPEEMTVVMQHQFWDLEVTDTGFSVSLSFNGVPERLVVPYASITGFLDPSVQFGLQFETDSAADAAASDETAELPGTAPASEFPAQDTPETIPAPTPLPVRPDDGANAENGAEADDSETPAVAEAGTDADADNQGAEVVSLDTFRKKN